MQRVLFFLLVSILLGGCKKEKLDIPFLSIATGTDLDLYQVQKSAGGIIFLCGGKNNKGIILKSSDNGKAWQLVSNFSRNIYSVCFLDSLTGFAGSDSSVILKTDDGGITWNRFIDYNGVPQLHQVPLRNFYFTNPDHGFVCGGKGFGKGIIYQTTDGGQSWSKTLSDHELRSLSVSGNSMAICAGYGAVYHSSDLSSWNLTDNVDGEFYTGTVFNSNFYSCGFNGGIYKSADGLDWKILEKPNNTVSKRYHFNSIDAVGATVFCSGVAGVSSYSRDNGDSFETGEAFGGSYINSVVLLSETKGLAAGNDGKLYEFSL